MNILLILLFILIVLIVSDLYDSYIKSKCRDMVKNDIATYCKDGPLLCPNCHSTVMKISGSENYVCINGCHKVFNEEGKEV